MRLLGVFGALEAISCLVQGIGGAETGKGHQEGFLGLGIIVNDVLGDFMPVDLIEESKGIVFGK